MRLGAQTSGKRKRGNAGGADARFNRKPDGKSFARIVAQKTITRNERKGDIMSESYVVIYYSGGNDRGEWREIWGWFDKSQALDAAKELEHIGYHTLTVKRADLRRHGLPEGAPKCMSETKSNCQVCGR